jgi:Mn-containing catalase
LRISWLGLSRGTDRRLHYFTQAFVLREKNPEMYDLFVDIAAEELSHLEMVGSMITMLLDGLDDDLKVATQRCYWLPAVASATVTSKRFTRSRSTRCSWC